MTAALEGDEWSAARPGRTLHPGKNLYLFTGGWVGPRTGLEGQKISSPPGFFLFISSNTDKYNLSKLSEDHLCIWMLSEIQVNVKTEH